MRGQLLPPTSVVFDGRTLLFASSQVAIELVEPMFTGLEADGSNGKTRLARHRRIDLPATHGMEVEVHLLPGSVPTAVDCRICGIEPSALSAAARWKAVLAR